MTCSGYIKTTAKSSYGAPLDSCVLCGKTEAAHEPLEPVKQTIKVYFNKKFYEFENWEEAQKAGFFLIQ